MQFRAFVFLLILIFSVSAHSQHIKPILIQGAMSCEVDQLVLQLKNKKLEKIRSWFFWQGNLNGYPVIISKTNIGAANSAAATAIAIEHFHPVAIINQGLAGGLNTKLHLYDIVIGKETIDLAAFKTPFRSIGQGSNSLEWKPLRLVETKKSKSKIPDTLRSFQADPKLLSAAVSAKKTYQHGNIFQGNIGSSEIWDNELDRINYLNSQFDVLAEDMETASAAHIAAEFHVPFIGIRVISNNITISDEYKRKASTACQDYVLKVVKLYVRKTA
jgi:adenosylhomocysteine nucleosidase